MSALVKSFARTLITFSIYTNIFSPFSLFLALNFALALALTPIHNIDMFLTPDLSPAANQVSAPLFLALVLLLLLTNLLLRSCSLSFWLLPTLLHSHFPTHSSY